MKLLYFSHFVFGILLCSQVSWGKPMALSGKISDLTGNPIQSQNVLFKVSISSLSHCIVYEEQFTQNMSGSNGFFKIPVGSGIPVFNGNGVPSNTYSPGSYYCKDGSQWVAGKNDLRKIAVSVKIDSDPWVDFSSDIINSVAYAETAERLNGLTSDSFIKAAGSVTQNQLEDLISKKPQIDELLEGTAIGYVKSSDLSTAMNAKQDKLTYTPMNPLQNLNDVQNKTQARTNLGLGALAILNQVSDAQISSLQWTKILQKPTAFPPEDHSHAMTQVIGLNSALNTKQNSSSMTSVRCTSSQTISYSAVLDRFECQDINLTSKLAGTSINTTALAEGDALYYNLAQNSWVNRPVRIGGYPTNFNNLKSNDIIVFDNTSKTWINSEPAASGIVGSVITYAGSECPPKTLVANGQAVLKSQYPELYAAFKGNRSISLYGEPSGTTFSIPNYMGTFLRGAQVSTGSDPDFASRDSGSIISDSNAYKVGSRQSDELKSHAHNIRRGNDAGSGQFPLRGYNSLMTTDRDSGTMTNTTTGSLPFVQNTGGNETRPKNVYVLYCIYSAR